MKIISFGHRQRTGKDTATRFLISHLRTNNQVRKLSVQKAGFADKVKSIAFELYKWAGIQPNEFYEDPVHSHLKDVVLPKINKSPRAIWIGIGNGLRSSVYDGTWYTYLFNSAACDVLIIKDMRFPIEALGILAQGGFVYRIDRPDAPKIDDGAEDPLEGFTGWTGVINNDGTLAEFHRKIVAIAEGLVL